MIGILYWCGRRIAFLIEFLGAFLVWFYADSVRQPIGRMNDVIASFFLGEPSLLNLSGSFWRPSFMLALLIAEGLIVTTIFSFVLRRILRGTGAVLTNRRGAAPAAANPAPVPAPVVNRNRGGGALTMFERIRHMVLASTLFASLLFAMWEWAILTGNLRATTNGTPEQSLNDMFIVAVVCMVYHAFCVAGLLCRRPAQVGWEFFLFIFSVLPLIVLCIYTFRWGSAFTAFQWRAWIIMWMVEGVDIVEVSLVALQLTRRSSIGFGVVDDAGNRM